MVENRKGENLSVCLVMLTKKQQTIFTYFYFYTMEKKVEFCYNHLWCYVALK